MYKDVNLNVVNAISLIDEMLSVYRPNSEYSMFSIDVVSMFDNISMHGVLDVIKNYTESVLQYKVATGRMVEIFVNINVLEKLVCLDSNLFDYFR